MNDWVQRNIARRFEQPEIEGTKRHRIIWPDGRSIILDTTPSQLPFALRPYEGQDVVVELIDDARSAVVIQAEDDGILDYVTPPALGGRLGQLITDDDVKEMDRRKKAKQTEKAAKHKKLK